MTSILLIAVIGALIFSEMRLKHAISRIGIAIVACAVCAGISINIGRDIGNAAARNLVSIRVYDALLILEKCDSQESKESFRKLLKVMSEELPVVLLDDRKSIEFLSEIERGKAQDK